MRLTQIKNHYLYEGLDYSQRHTVSLWESAGFKLKEAALTADQIQQIFQSVEKGSTDAGSNRTLLGKGKDTVVAVNKAWEDLKSKIQNSGPIKGFDQKVSDALSKIGMGAAEPEFNGKVNQWVQKYRDFAKKHPIAQGAIYATLIALAGITGAGVGGAAALGLLKMADKLLQGERFSSAAYSGVKAGAMAFASSKLGDYLKGMKAGDQVPQPQAGDLPPGAPKMDFDKYDYYVGDSNNVVAVPRGSPNPLTGANNVSQATSAASSTAQKLSDFASDPNLNPVQQKLAALIDAGKPLNQNQQDFLMKAIEKASLKANMLGDMPDGSANAGMRQFMSLQAMANAAKFENKLVVGKKLSEGQVYMIFNRISEHTVVMEGPMDAIKGAAGKAAQWLQTKGKNLTTKVTADKLNSAWQKAGSPMDSDELAVFLKGQGVDQNIVDKVYADLKLPTAKSKSEVDAEPKGQTAYIQVKDTLKQLNKKDKQRLIAYLQKQLGTA